MSITLSALQQQRRDTAANWTSANPTLLAAEWGYETDTGKWKVGDGSTAWTALAYVGIADASGNLGGNITIGGNLTVNGTTTTIESTTVTIEDKNIQLATVDTPTDTTADGGGFTIKGATDKTFNWVNSTNCFTSSERLDLPAGTEALPALIFNGETDSGIYKPAADTLGFCTSGDEKLRIDSSGNVGLGTISPDQLLDLQANGTGSAAGPFLRFTDGYSGAWTANTDSSGIEFYSADTSGPGIGVRSKIANTVEDTSGAAQALTFWTTTNTSGQSLTERLRISHDGNVGIGTSSPGGNLTVTDASTYTVDIKANGSDGALITTLGGSASLALGTDGAEKMRITAGGNVGIGQSSPGFPLAVYANVSSTSGYVFGIDNEVNFTQANATVQSSYLAYPRRTDTNTTATVQNFRSDFGQLSATEAAVGRITTACGFSHESGLPKALTNVGFQSALNNETLVGSTSVKSFNFRATGTAPNFFAGDVGIGFDSPLGKLHVRAADECNFVVREESTRLVLSAETNSGRDNNRQMDLEADGFKFVDSGTERMFINSSGSIALHGNGDPGGTPVGVSIQNSTTAGTIQNNTTAASGVEYQTFRASGTQIGSITRNGTSNTAYNTSSDYRLKENVVGIVDGIERLKLLNPRRFSWILDQQAEPTQDGFIAHEVQGVIPEAVTGTKDATDSDGRIKPQGIDQSKLVPLLTAALQEAIAKIETLDAKVAALEAG